MRNGEPVFDVRELEGEGGGIKVVQEVCFSSHLRTEAGLMSRKGRSCGYLVDGIIKSSTSISYVSLLPLSLSLVQSVQ